MGAPSPLRLLTRRSISPNRSLPSITAPSGEASVSPPRYGANTINGVVEASVDDAEMGLKIFPLVSVSKQIVFSVTYSLPHHQNADARPTAEIFNDVSPDGVSDTASISGNWVSMMVRTSSVGIKKIELFGKIP